MRAPASRTVLHPLTPLLSAPSTCAVSAMSQRTIAYFHDLEVGNFHYGPSHPMKPHRLALTHALVSSYDLLKKMKVYKPRRASHEELLQFHDEDYIDFLQRVTPETNLREKMRFNVFGDCPGFHDVYDFCQIYTGASLDAASKLIQQDADICVNWSGGLHHARKSEASGFCYVNDIVLAILELLKVYSRVLYIDIDIHHGDGVQDAFYHSDRVMCVSLHKFGESFFPGTGDTNEIGYARGKFYSLNVPLRDGIEDTQYKDLFEPILEATVQKFRPDVIVLQCGADSLRDDRIGLFNLSLDGHAHCVSFMKKFNIPMIVLGGGGYTVKNVARCWANETAVLLDTPISNDIPFNEYFEHYAPHYQLHNPIQSRVNNQNSPAYVEQVRIKCLEHLRELECAPSVQMSQVPATFFMEDLEKIFAQERAIERGQAEEHHFKEPQVVNSKELYDNDRDVDRMDVERQ